jgi:ABC-2 type transport system ATP-binding protein
LADVEDVCDRIAILYNGRVRASGRVNELLQRQDRIQLTLPALPPGQIRDVIARLRDQIGSDPEVAHPAMNLEQFFLEVVERAHQGADDPSGAARSAGVAQYLVAPQNPEPPPG